MSAAVSRAMLEQVADAFALVGPAEVKLTSVAYEKLRAPAGKHWAYDAAGGKLTLADD